MRQFKIASLAVVPIALLAILIVFVSGCGGPPPKPAAPAKTDEEVSFPKWGYIDPTGLLIIPAQFEVARSFSEGYAGVRQGGLWGFIDKTGKFVIPCHYQDVGPFSEGL